jgi:hypothetical protein
MISDTDKVIYRICITYLRIETVALFLYLKCSKSCKRYLDPKNNILEEGGFKD